MAQVSDDPHSGMKFCVDCDQWKPDGEGEFVITQGGGKTWVCHACIEGIEKPLAARSMGDYLATQIEVVHPNEQDVHLGEAWASLYKDMGVKEMAHHIMMQFDFSRFDYEGGEEEMLVAVLMIAHSYMEHGGTLHARRIT